MAKTKTLSILSALLLMTAACGEDRIIGVDTGVDTGAADTGGSTEDSGIDLDSGTPDVSRVDAGDVGAATDGGDGDAGDASGADGGDEDASTADGGDASLGPKRVFLTEARYAGDLRAEFGTASGAEAADAACQAAARGAGLAGTFVGWLSDPTATAASRIADVGPWYRLDGAMVFASAAEFTTGPAVPIEITEHGLPPTGGTSGVWTGTRFDGRLGHNCDAWTRGDTDLGGAGRYTETGSDWTDVGWPALTGNMCTSRNHLYCFEQ